MSFRKGQLKRYADYYNRDRTHLALDKDAPKLRPSELEGTLLRRAVLGGLHHRCGRAPPK